MDFFFSLFIEKDIPMSTFVCDLCLALSSQGTCLLGDPSHNGWDTITQKPLEGGQQQTKS